VKTTLNAALDPGVTGTPAATLKALGSLLGPKITQAAGSTDGLTIGEGVTIALGGTSQKKVGEIVLKGAASNPRMITFTKDTSKITTGNTGTAIYPVATDGTTAISGTNDVLGIGGSGSTLVGDGTNAKATTTAAVANNALPAGYLVSLEGTSSGGTNRVGGRPLFERPSSHTTVRTVRYTAVQ
jgi:hypothetical protein